LHKNGLKAKYISGCDAENKNIRSFNLKSVEGAAMKNLAENAKGLKIAVLCGGIGDEREISLQSGSNVYEALRQGGFETVLADFRPDDIGILDDKSIDVFFIAMHGRFGEDGELQQILEDKSLCYTGSAPEACRLAFDKMESKKLFNDCGIRTPAAITIDQYTNIEIFETELGQFAHSFVIKPLRQGSSVGVSIVDTARDAVIAAEKTVEEFGACMIEEFIPGREVTQGIVCGRALPIIEIRPAEKFYNYNAKYLDEKTQFLFDTIEDNNLKEEIRSTAMKCFEVLGMRDFARVDFILGDDEQLYALEVNTIPGLTAHSLVPMAAAKANISMSELCTQIINSAMENKKVSTVG
jgi:D-alanine-D-alanine ligase